MRGSHLFAFRRGSGAIVPPAAPPTTVPPPHKMASLWGRPLSSPLPTQPPTMTHSQALIHADHCPTALPTPAPHSCPRQGTLTLSGTRILFGVNKTVGCGVVWRRRAVLARAAVPVAMEGGCGRDLIPGQTKPAHMGLPGLANPAFPHHGWVDRTKSSHLMLTEMSLDENAKWYVSETKQRRQSVENSTRYACINEKGTHVQNESSLSGDSQK